MERFSHPTCQLDDGPALDGLTPPHGSSLGPNFLLRIIADYEHVTDGSPCPCNPREQLTTADSYFIHTRYTMLPPSDPSLCLLNES